MSNENYQSAIGWHAERVARYVKFALYCTCFASVSVAVYVLPYHWHLFQLPLDESLTTATGYDRRAASVSIMAVLAAFGAVLFFRPGVMSSTHDFRPIAYDIRSNRSLRLMARVSTMAILALVWFHSVNITDSNFEGGYFTVRMAQMEFGKVPYRDFQFNYGPALIYFPFVTMKATGLGVLKAYFLALGCVFALALYIYHGLIERLPIFGPHKSIIYVTTLVFWLPISYSTGLHYAFLRFLMPITLAFFLPGLLERSKPPIAFFGLVASTVFCFLLSFEIGLSFVLVGAAACIYCGLKERRPVLWLMLLFYVALFLAMMAALPRGFVQEFISNTAGREFPAIPSVFSLAFFACLTFSVLTAGQRLWLRLFQGRDARDSAEIGLDFIVVAAIALLPGALGRQDFGHLYAYGFGFFLFALAYVSRHRNHAVFGIIALAVGNLGLLYTIASAVIIADAIGNGPAVQSIFASGDRYAPAFLCTVLNRCPGDKRPRVQLPEPGKSDADMIAASYPNIYDPFEMANPTRDISTGYYTGLHDVMNARAIDVKSMELQSHAYYLLPPGFDKIKSSLAPETLYSEVYFYRFLSLYPFPIALVNNTAPPANRREFFEALFKNCVRTLETNNFTVCRNAAYGSSTERPMRPFIE